LRHPWGLLRAQFVNGRSALITREAQNDVLGKSAYWKLPSETRNTEYLSRLARLLSGSPSGERNATNTAAECQKAWNQLHAECLNDFTVTPEQIIQWDVRQAEASERTDQWPTALLYWRRLIRARPENMTFRQREDFALEVLSFCTR
jgi:hypothetical protein